MKKFRAIHDPALNRWIIQRYEWLWSFPFRAWVRICVRDSQGEAQAILDSLDSPKIIYPNEQKNHS